MRVKLRSCLTCHEPALRSVPGGAKGVRTGLEGCLGPQVRVDRLPSMSKEPN